MAGICDVPVISTVCDVAGEGAATLVSAPFDWLAQACAQAASWMFQGVWGLFDSTTLVDLTSPSYVGVYNVIFGIAVFLMLIFFCLQLIGGLIRRDPSALTRAATGLARSVLGSFLVLTLTATLLQVVDQLCLGIIQATGTTLQEMGGKIAVLVTGLTAINLAAPGAGAIVTIFLAFLAIAAAAIVWFSLLVRKALILVGVVLAPIALSGSSWDAARGWFGRWAGFVLALIFSKLVVVVVFLVAINQVNAPIDADLASISDPVAGIVLMFIAGFAPYMTYKLISFAGFDMYHSMSVEQEAKQSMNRPIPTPGKPDQGTVRQVLTDTGDSGSGASPTVSTTPSGGSGVVGSAGGGATTGAVSGGAATGGGAAGGSAAAAGAAAGPVGAVAVAGAEVVADVSNAGPRLGAGVGRAGDEQAAAAQAAQTPPPAPEQAAATTRDLPPAPAAPPAAAPPTRAQDRPPATPRPPSDEPGDR